MHSALSCMYFDRGETYIFAEGGGIHLTPKQLKVFSEFRNKFWMDVMNIDTPIIQDHNLNKIMRQLRGNVTIEPFSLSWDLETLMSFVDGFKGKLFGSNEPITSIYNSVRALKRKTKSYQLCGSINEEMLLPDVTYCDIDSLENTVTALLPKYPKLVVKSDYGQGGKGSAIISSPTELIRFLAFTKTEQFRRKLEIKEVNGFVVEPFFEHTIAPSLGYYIHDDKIEFVYMHDRITDNMLYISCSTPSRSTHVAEIKDFCLTYTQLAHKSGYRGFINFEFMENEVGEVKFCEVNARYTGTFYPYFSHLNEKPFNLKWVHFDKELSYNVYQEIAGDFIFNPSSQTGVMPLNIPSFTDPLHQCALLIVGDTEQDRDNICKEVEIKLNYR